MVTINKGNAVFLQPKPRVYVNQSGLVTRKLGDLVDVDVSENTDGSLLVYDSEEGKFKATTLLQNQTLNGGNF
jgi:hypothetical protein